MVRTLTDGGRSVMATRSTRGVIASSRRLVTSTLLARVVLRSLTTDS